ncbi:MAG: hypothetical protein Kow00127_25050 [Bacteroidales bacterium]
MIAVDEIKDQLRKFIAETAFVEESTIKDDTLIFNEGIFDSMGFLSLINFIEENFRIKAEDSELLEENFESVSAIAQFIERKATS